MKAYQRPDDKLQNKADTLAQLHIYDLLTDDVMILDSSKVVDGKPAFYKVGPPAVAWGRLPDNEHISIPVLIVNEMTTNDPLYNPSNWRIKLIDVVTQEHPDGQTPTVRGELIHIIPVDQRVKKLPPTSDTRIEKGVSSSANVFEITSPNTTARIRLGNSGSIDFIGENGKLIASFSVDSIITNVQMKERHASGDRIRGLFFKERSFTTTLIPRAFPPPFNMPAESGSLELVKRGITHIASANELALANAKITKRQV